MLMPLLESSILDTSMKVPTRRWGNVGNVQIGGHTVSGSLNESPHPKVGKFEGAFWRRVRSHARPQ